MIRKFETQIPLPMEDTFKLLNKSGADILSWKTNKADPEDGYLEWKQSLWSLTGTAAISARLKQVSETSTTVTVEVFKTFQLVDPLGLCEKIFNKLVKSCQKNLEMFQSGEKE